MELNRKSAKIYRFKSRDRGRAILLTDYSYVCLPYLPLGEREEVDVYLNAKKDFPSERHHNPPSSRRGQTITMVNPVVHWAWHVLFGNDLVEEVIAKIIHCWQDERGQIKEKYLLGKVKNDSRGTRHDVRYLAYCTFFGDTRSVQEAIGIIQTTFPERT